MNNVLWVIQILLGIKFISVAYTHGLRQNQPTMQHAIQKMGDVSRPLLYIIAVFTLIGSAGLILPPLMEWPGWITPVIAALLAIATLLSIIFHIKAREKPNIFASVILCALVAFVAYGRWALVPF